MKADAIIFDIDGTAIDSPDQKIPSEQLITVMEQLKEKYYFCAATGRVWSFAKPVIQGLQLTDPCIISAGTQICDPVTGEILWQKNVNEDSLKKVIEIFKEYPDYRILYNDGTEDDYTNGGMYPKDFNATEPIYFIEQVFIPDAIALEIHKKLITIKDVTCVMAVAHKPGMRDLHVINHEATKEHAIAELLKIINIDKSRTIGIGDGHNDLHLFNGVAHKVAMDNAVPDLKEASDEIIGSVKNDGMAKYLETLLTV